MSPITVIKRDINGVERWRYNAELIQRAGGTLHLEASYNGREINLMGTCLLPGDHFKELFFTDRWYNIFEVHDQNNGSLKGWYCNIGKPAVMEEEAVLSYIDLALDLWVSPEGQQTVLDEDEFEKLDLDESTRRCALEALKELVELFHENQKPGALRRQAFDLSNQGKS